MSAVVLGRIDPARNMARFYRLDVQPTLFGDWALVKEWGRIGSGGTVRSAVFDSEEAAEAARVRQQRVKEQRGYQARPGAGPYVYHPLYV